MNLVVHIKVHSQRDWEAEEKTFKPEGWSKQHQGRQEWLTF